MSFVSASVPYVNIGGRGGASPVTEVRRGCCETERKQRRTANTAIGRALSVAAGHLNWLYLYIIIFRGRESVSGTAGEEGRESELI